MTGVASGSSTNEDRRFILECTEIYKSLLAMWDVKSKEYSNHEKNNMHVQFCFTNILTDTQKQTRQDVTKKCNSLRANFRMGMKIDNSEKKSGTGSEGFLFPFHTESQNNAHTSSIRVIQHVRTAPNYRKTWLTVLLNRVGRHSTLLSNNIAQ